MTEKDKKELMDSVSQTIKEVVNGKIDRQREEMQTFLKSFYEASKTQLDMTRNLERKVDQYIIDDNNWKKMANPVVEMGKNVQGFSKVSLYIVGFIASVTAAMAGIMTVIKKD